jgi:hypothetical protein
MLERMKDPELRRRVQVGLNKGEARNALARVIFFNRQGDLRDRSFENNVTAQAPQPDRRCHHPLEYCVPGTRRRSFARTRYRHRRPILGPPLAHRLAQRPFAALKPVIKVPYRTIFDVWCSDPISLRLLTPAKQQC